MNTRTTSEQVTLVPIFLFYKKISHLLHCSSFFAKGHARFACWLASALTTALGRCQPFASIRLAAQEFSVWNKLRLFRFFYFTKKSVTCCTAPPFSQKVTLGSPAGLQAHSRRLSVAVNLLRVFALRRKNFPFGTSYACFDFYCKRSKLLLSVFSFIVS